MTEKFTFLLENICFKKENAKFFLNNGYNSLASLEKINEEELLRIGFENPIERKGILFYLYNNSFITRIKKFFYKNEK
jgi:hypothetical protein